MKPMERSWAIARAQRFFGLALARLYELPTDEVVADAILFASAGLLQLSKSDESDKALELAIEALKGMLPSEDS